MSSSFTLVGKAAEAYGKWDARLRLEVPFLASVLLEHGARRVCDAGCGEGRHTTALAQAGFAMTGVEPRAEALAVARDLAREAGAQLCFHEGEFSTLPTVPGAPFDAVVAYAGSCPVP